MISNAQEKITARFIFAIKSIIYFLFAIVARATNKNELLVLCYHQVNFKQDFYKQMEYLRKKFDVVSLEEITHSKQKKLSRSSVAITFDDGYLDVFLNAYPYFRKYNLPATIFITTGCVGKKMRNDNKYLPMLNWSEIKAMSENKIEMGAHTITHPKLTQISEDAAIQEIVGSKMEIERKTGKPVNFFCFPSNIYNERVVNLVKKLGFKNAIGGFGAIEKSGDCFLINRIAVDESVNFIMFKARLTRATNYFNKFEQIVKKIAIKLRMTQFIRFYDNTDQFIRETKN